MTETARQDKGRYWSVTTYDPGEFGLISNKESWPHYVRECKFQQEKCPTTGKLHWQVALLTEQVRFSAIKKFLPTAHIELARNKDALLNYVEKDDTAVPATRQHIKAEKEYLALHQQLQRMAHVVVENMEDYLAYLDQCRDEKVTNPAKAAYWWVAGHMLEDNPELAAMLANPALEKMWIHTSMVWIKAAKAASEASSITASPKIEASGITNALPPSSSQPIQEVCESTETS